MAFLCFIVKREALQKQQKAVFNAIPYTDAIKETYYLTNNSLSTRFLNNSQLTAVNTIKK